MQATEKADNAVKNQVALAHRYSPGTHPAALIPLARVRCRRSYTLRKCWAHYRSRAAKCPYRLSWSTGVACLAWAGGLKERPNDRPLALPSVVTCVQNELAENSPCRLAPSLATLYSGNANRHASAWHGAPHRSPTVRSRLARWHQESRMER